MTFSVIDRYVFACAALCISLSTHAGLTVVDIDGQEGVYDDVLDITWLADANYAMTSGFDADGRVTWTQAEAFIADLNTNSYLGVTTWRQASASGACFGNNCGDAPIDSDDELGYHYYQNFGAIVAGGITNGSNTDNLALFSGIEVSKYWTGTASGASTAITFDTNTGSQASNTKTAIHFVWVVAPGMVGTPQSVNVPVLPYWAFIILGVTLVALKRRAVRS